MTISDLIITPFYVILVYSDIITKLKKHFDYYKRMA